MKSTVKHCCSGLLPITYSFLIVEQIKTLNVKEEKLPLEASFNLHQKMILLGVSLLPGWFVVELSGRYLGLTGYLFLIFFLSLFFYLVSLAFSKKGLVKKGHKLYKAKIFNGVTLSKRKVDLTDRPVVSILKFRKSQKMIWFSIAKPDLAQSFNSFEVFVLNERHIKRDSVMYFESEENANKAVDFLTTGFPLKHEIFSPNFSGIKTAARG